MKHMEPNFVSFQVLNEIRVGKMSERVEKYLTKLTQQRPKFSCHVCRLYGTKKSIIKPYVWFQDGPYWYVFNEIYRFINLLFMKVEMRALPLQYAYSLTVHRSQGMSLEEGEVDLTECQFQDGMVRICAIEL